MRNPIRLKNLQLRYIPIYALGVLVLALSRPTRMGFAVGLFIVLLGAALRSWGAGHLVKNDHLTVTGPYAHVRHPLYAGTLLIAIGFSVILGGWIAPSILALVLLWFFLDYFPRKERIESARLERRHGSLYALYRSQVPALLPVAMARRLAAVDHEPPESERRRWSVEHYLRNNELGTVLALVAGLSVFAVRFLIPR